MSLNKKELLSLVGLIILFISGATYGSDNYIEVTVSIEGVENELAESIQNNLFIHSLTCDETEWRIRHALKKIDAELGEILNAFGYYKSSFVKRLEKLETCWQVSLDIEPGQRTKVDLVEVRIEGDANVDNVFKKAIENLPIKKGDLLRHDKYEKIKELIEATAQTRGYFDGKYNRHMLRISKAKNLAEIIIHYESGPRYRFGDVKYESIILKEELFKKLLSIKPGDYYHSSNITKTYQDLSGTGYYKDVEIKAFIDQRQEGFVPIEIKLVKSKRRSYSVGVGVSTDTGPRLRLEHKNKRVNLQGHNYNAKMLLSPVMSNLSFNYKIPIGKPQTDFVSLQIGAAHEDTDSSESDSIVANIGRTKLRDNAWLENIFLEFLQEDFETGEDDETSSLLMPGISWAKTRSNNPIHPTSGYHLTFETRAAAQALLSDVNLLQLKFNSKSILPIGEKARFLTRLEAGYSFIDDFGELPASLRFFAGGDSSIRGYDYQSLGPEGSDGDVVGGEGLLVGSLETDYLFKPNWALATFIDGGNAFETNDIQIKQSVGIGVRWLSVIGPIKLDVAFPIDDDEEDDFRIHFSLGPEL